jgi:DNA-binding response OmpR family regulator
MNEKIKKIILIEDDPAIADIYETIMKGSHFNVETINCGQDAIKRIKDLAEEQEKPDIILLDLVLPDINGIDVFKEIKSNEKTKDIKVFIFTNQQDSQLEWPEGIKPDKFLIKADTTPSNLMEIIKQELK